MRFVHGLHAALRFPRRLRLGHFDEASRKAGSSADDARERNSLASCSPAFRDARIHQLKETEMFNLKTKLATAAMTVAAAGAFATPAIAGQCATPGVNALANAPTMPKGVTDTVIGDIALGAEIGVDGRQLRTRRLVVQPGGIVPLHSHKDRPALIYTLSGSITEYSSTCSVPIEHKAGDISREADGLSHYWVNHGKVPTVLLSSDVFHGM
jgi:quercetin dioxygenase-like cupin family protein